MTKQSVAFCLWEYVGRVLSAASSIGLSAPMHLCHDLFHFRSGEGPAGGRVDDVLNALLAEFDVGDECCH